MTRLDLLRETNLSVLVKLGSIARHAEEMTSPSGVGADYAALRGLLDDPEVKAWMAEADKASLLPVKR